MANERRKTPGEALHEVDTDLGTLLGEVVDNHFAGKDRRTAQAIREAETLEEAMAMVTSMRVGRLRDVALVTSGVAGVLVGLLAQNTLDLRVRGVSPWTAVGAGAALVGAFSEHSFRVRTTLAVGGASFALGNWLWTKHRPHEGGAP